MVYELKSEYICNLIQLYVHVLIRSIRDFGLLKFIASIICFSSNLNNHLIIISLEKLKN